DQANPIISTPTTVVAPGKKWAANSSLFWRMRRLSVPRRSTDSARWQWSVIFGSHLHRFTVLTSVLKLHLRLTDGGCTMTVGTDEKRSKPETMIVTGAGHVTRTSMCNGKL